MLFISLFVGNFMKKLFLLILCFTFSGTLFAELFGPEETELGTIFPKQCSSGKWGYFKKGELKISCSNGVNTNSVRTILIEYARIGEDGHAYLNIFRWEVAEAPAFKYAKNVIDVMKHCSLDTSFDADTKELVFHNAVSITPHIPCKFDEASPFWLTDRSDAVGKNKGEKWVAWVQVDDLEGSIGLDGKYIIGLHHPAPVVTRSPIDDHF